MTTTIQINGKDVVITLTKEQVRQIESQNNMQKVYAYHNTTEEQFEKDYENIPLHLKYLQKEIMIVAYKNNGWKPDMNDNNQKKYYPYFYNSPFRFVVASWYGVGSGVPASLLLKSEELVREMVNEFLPELSEYLTFESSFFCSYIQSLS